MNKGFAKVDSLTSEKKNLSTSKKSQGRLISWSPWPPASFQTQYPAFPFVLTLLILIIGGWYFSLV